MFGAPRKVFKIEGARKLNFGCGWDLLPEDQGWVNGDGFVKDPRVVRFDFTKFPYPFKEDEFDVVYARHVFEHIPFVYPVRNGVATDVLFLILEELFRILKSGGRLHFLVPLAGTTESKGHPGHYRELSPESLAYFAPGTVATAEPGKYHAANFVVAGVRMNRRAVRHPNFLRMGPSGLGVETHLVTRFPRLFGEWFSWFVLGKNQMEAVVVARK